jgi:hypothetical protein
MGGTHFPSVTGLGITLYTDEMVYSRFAAALRGKGYDAVSCAEASHDNRGIADEDQLTYAAAHDRAILTGNGADFYPLDAAWEMSGRMHAGIVVLSGIETFGELLRRVITHLDTTSPEARHDALLWLP